MPERHFTFTSPGAFAARPLPAWLAAACLFSCAASPAERATVAEKPRALPAASAVAASPGASADLSLIECESSRKTKVTDCEGTIRSKRSLSVSEALLIWDAPELARARARLALDLNGTVVATNRAKAPPCAFRLPPRDAPDCDAPVPAVWIADSPHEPPSASLMLATFAPSFATMFAAYLYTALPDTEPYRDQTGAWVASELPTPGTRVKLRARLVQSASAPLPDAPPLDPEVARVQITDESFDYFDENPRFEPWPEPPPGLDAEQLYPFELYAQATARAQPKCAEASVTVGKPWEAHFLSKDSVTRVFPVTCSTSTPILGTYPDETTGELVEHTIGSTTDVSIFLAHGEQNRRFFDFECDEGTGYESSWSCGSAWFVLPGAGKDLDLLVRFDSGCSDAGCDAELSVTGFFEGAPELPPFPDQRDIQDGRVKLIGREVHIDGDMACTTAEWERVRSDQCTVPRRYVLRYERGKLRLLPR